MADAVRAAIQNGLNEMRKKMPTEEFTAMLSHFSALLDEPCEILHKETQRLVRQQQARSTS
eukprot:9417789-Prorocentrum_lima.AAC.1